MTRRFWLNHRRAPVNGRKAAPRRPGAVLPMVLTTLAIAMLLCAALLQHLALHAGKRRRAEHQQQAAWLADSALLRGMAELARNPDYTGETWTIPAGDLDGREGAQAVIGIDPVPGEDRLRLHVEAHYPIPLPHRVLIQRETYITRNRSGASS